MKREPVVSKSDDGRTVMVLDSDNGVFGSFVDDNWAPRNVPSADELMADFSRMAEPEASIWVKKARMASSS